MIGNAMYTTILTLWKQKKSKSEIARITDHDRKTIRTIINKYETQGTSVPLKKPVQLTLAKYQESILAFLEKDLSVVRIKEELTKLGYEGSYPTLTRFVNHLKGKQRICIRFHTMPGEEAQVDFGYVGKLLDLHGKLRKAWVFNMRLSYSRLDYYEVVFDQKVETFINCHINAFKYFGGIPHVIKIDNLKAAILEANFYEPVYQQYYKNFADHYNFSPIPCRVRKPQEKGKIEAGIKYVKNNFFAGRSFSNYAQLTSELRYWLDHQCNCRIHGTTKRKPRDLFETEEKAKLTKLPISEFNILTVRIRKVHDDCHISVKGNYYSVPFNYVGKIVEVQLSKELVKVYYQMEQIAVHPHCYDKGRFITCNAHYPKYKLCGSHIPEYQEQYRQKLQMIGKNAAKMFEQLLLKEPYSWHRATKGIVSLQKVYSNEVIDASCARALAFDLTLYSKIKSICESGCYNLPLELKQQGGRKCIY